MFTKPKSPSQLLLEDELIHALKTLRGQTPGSPDYNKTLDSAVKIFEMTGRHKPTSVSKDTLATVGANILGIFMIIKHESVNVITSKALSFVMRVR